MAKRQQQPRERAKPIAPPEAAPPARRPRDRQMILLSGLALLFAIYYFWTASPCSTWHVDCSPNPVRVTSGEIVGPYNVLADAFLSGQTSLTILPHPGLLRLPDPYDPRQNGNYRIHDLSLYNGRYYIAFGPTPVLLVFAPFRFLTGAYLPDALGCALLALGAYVIACFVLRLFLARLFPALPPWVLPLLCFGLGLCSTFPYLLRRPAVYETAIVGGQFCLLSALLLWARVLFGASRRPLLEAAAGGVMAALAFASRPPLLFPICGLYLVLLIAPAPSAKYRRDLLGAALIPFLAGGLLVAWYNYARFDSPFEFGYHYQLAGIRTDQLSFFQPSRFPAALYFYLLSPPTLSSTFPYVHILKQHPPFDLPADYANRIEEVAGILWLSPLLLALFVPWFWKPRRDSAGTPAATGVSLKTWVVVFVASSIPLLCMDGSVGATMRYESDVSLLLFLAAGMVSAWLLTNGPPRVRKIAPGFAVGAVAWGLILNSAIALTGYYDLLKRIEPDQYHALESLFQPVGWILGAVGVPPKPPDTTP